ncbi:TRAP transporter substrate-binding protein [Halomonas mongoliensis]|uniref:TRAP transporter substrate-binding protein n=1 Tax=Halomonas mongoliensis TaxID=321265 RepID=A0ABU1GSB1_9GAMM|nr:TRAP transporter substrate-binding protein [Halomonas mongoliensis]MDR5894298.1 TRAP transporter substrate-binding protein [Halomonas mongoliensis]
MNRTLTRCLLAASIAGLAAASTAQASTTLRMSHFWPDGSGINQEIFQAWAETIEEQSGGELRVENFPSQTLTRADQAYQGAVNGISDIAITAQGYTAGRFPLSQIVELPGVSDTASQGACILQSLYDDGHIAGEYDDTRVLFMFTTGPGYLHTADHDIQSPDDLAGLRIRRPTAVAGEMLERLGAQPVGMPAPDIYTSLQRGVIDGLSFPWEGMKVFRLNELANYHTQVPFYSLIFVATMSQRSFDRLSPEQQAVIEANSGMAWSEVAGRVFDGLDEAGKQEAEEAGHHIRVIDSPLEHDDWAGPLKEGIENYLSELEGRGLDNAREVFDAAMAARDACPVDQS